MRISDKVSFVAYLHACTDEQVRGVFKKEFNAGRLDYALLADAELVRRGPTGLESHYQIYEVGA